MLLFPGTNSWSLIVFWYQFARISQLLPEDRSPTSAAPCKKFEKVQLTKLGNICTRTLPVCTRKRGGQSTRAPRPAAGPSGTGQAEAASCKKFEKVQLTNVHFSWYK